MRKVDITLIKLECYGWLLSPGIGDQSPSQTYNQRLRLETMLSLKKSDSRFQYQDEERMNNSYKRCGTATLLRSMALNALLLTGTFLIMDFLTGSAAHARRGFPLFIIISDNPVLLAIGAVCVVVWAVARE